MNNIWSTNQIIYQIYPRSFKDSNRDGIGDIRGIISRLDYLAGLGITAIWISPIYPSPMIDFGYDISEFCDIDPVFGNLSDFDELVNESHRRGIQVIMDYIPNHTSSEHPWFKESRSSRYNPKSGWYIWADPKKDGSPPNNWLAYFGGSAWEFDETRKQYYYHAFAKEQPDLNWRNRDVVTEMFQVMEFWLKIGVDGFRVDAISFLFEDKELKNESPNPHYNPEIQTRYRSLFHTQTNSQPETYQMVKQFAELLKKYHATYLITEFPSGATLSELMTMYKVVEWDHIIPFNFSFIKTKWDASLQKSFLDKYDRAVGTQFVPNFVLGNHDRPRVATRIGEAQARVAAIAQFTLRGIPFIYNGEELGMTNTSIPAEQIQDTYESQSPGFGLGRDPERTPMQWSEEKNAGFSDGNRTWLPVNENYPTVNVTSEENDPQSFLNLYKLLIKLKKSIPALHEGSYKPLPHPADNVLAFMREKDDQKVLILLNFDEKDKQISLEYKEATILAAASMEIREGEILDLTNVTLKGNEGFVCTI